MNNFQRVKELVCEDCGSKFFGVVGKYCPVCRKKRRQKRVMKVVICPSCGMEKRLFEGQEICTECAHAKAREYYTEERGIAIVAQRRRARQTGGKLTTIARCPNFDGGKVDCATCEPGSWKFKDCGKVVTAILLMFLAGFAHSYTIKATGHVVAVIVAPIQVPQPTETQAENVVVYTEIGPTLQVVY